MTQRRVSAIVLAGGRSSRFGRDKLAEPIEGTTLLARAVDAIRSSVSEVIVVVAPDGEPPLLRDVRLVRDDEAFEGPLAGLLAGLRVAREPSVLLTAGDMPDLQPAIPDMLLAALEMRGVEAVVLEDAARARPLPMALSRDAGREAAQRLIGNGERRLRSLIDALATTVIPEATWRALDPDGRSLRDIDTPDDLR